MARIITNTLPEPKHRVNTFGNHWIQCICGNLSKCNHSENPKSNFVTGKCTSLDDFIIHLHAPESNIIESEPIATEIQIQQKKKEIDGLVNRHLSALAGTITTKRNRNWEIRIVQ